VTVLWQANINKKQQDKLDQLFKTGHELHILVMNVEAFSTDKGRLFAAKFLRSHKSLMAIDESTTIKNPKAKRTKNILSLSPICKYRRVMTGSPVTKNPLDLYTQCQFLDIHHLGHESYYSFRNRYALMKSANISGRSINLVVGYQNLGELSDKLKPFSYRVLKEDCLDLPDKIYMKREIQLTDEQKKLYKQMRQEALATLNGKTVTTMTALTQLMRLHQITCGHFSADDGTIQEVKNNRLSELLDVLEEVEGKAIIWAHYQHDVMNIYKLLEDKYGPGSVVHYYGKTLPEQRDYAIKNFKNNDKVRFFVGTPQTGGYGITLVQANTVIYYSNGYDLEKRMQSEDRAHRIGQKSTVTYVDIIAQETVDTKIVKALRKKINIASKVMGEELRNWI
jgi:SNF2 family DNA or RNA helicase